MQIVKANLFGTVVESLFEHIYVFYIYVFYIYVFYMYECSVCMNARTMEEGIIQ